MLLIFPNANSLCSKVVRDKFDYRPTLLRGKATKCSLAFELRLS